MPQAAASKFDAKIAEVLHDARELSDQKKTGIHAARLAAEKAGWLAPHPKLVDVKQKVGRILVNAERARLLELVKPVTSAHQTQAEGTATRRR
jgi:hypothetical protein